MNPNQPGEFHDPALKDAIKRSVPAGQAPPRLREAVRAMLAAEAGSASAPTGRAPAKSPPAKRSYLSLRNPVTRSAIAAVVLVVVGCYIYVYNDVLFPRQQTTSRYVYTLPKNITDAMIKTHDDCTSQKDHHHLPGVPDDYAKIRDALSTKLNRRILSDAPQGQWQFHGASVCPVGNDQAGHLVFSSGDRKLSIFSLPAGDAAAPPGYGARPYEPAVGDHIVTGFALGDGLYCLVGSSADGSLGALEMNAIRDALMTRFLAEPSTQSAMSACEIRRLAFAQQD